MDKMSIMEKINAFAEKHNVEVYETMPEGWRVLQGALTAPCGTTWIHNNGSIIQKTKKTALLLDKWLIEKLEEKQNETKYFEF